jgi:RNA polymerase-binding transcription factor DksA
MATAPIERGTERPATPFSREELAAWREILIARRRHMVADISALERESVPTERISVSSNHLAEGGSDAQEQDLSVIAADSEKELVRQIDRALRKIDTGKPLPFGICEYTRRPIAKERLALLPWTPFSAEGAEYLELNRLELDDLLAEDE